MGDKMKKIQSKLSKLKQYNNVFRNLRSKSKKRQSETHKLQREKQVIHKTLPKQSKILEKSQKKPNQNKQKRTKKFSLKDILEENQKTQKIKTRKNSKILQQEKIQNNIFETIEQQTEETQRVQKNSLKKSKPKQKSSKQKKSKIKCQKKNEKKSLQLKDIQKSEETQIQKKILKRNTFGVLTTKQQNGIKYRLRGTFRLFNSQNQAQKLFIKEAYHTSDIDKQKYHIILGIESKIDREDEFDDLESYHEVLLNTNNIPQDLQGIIKNSQEFFDYLIRMKDKIQLCTKKGKIDSICYIKICQSQEHTIFIPLFYGKDKTRGKIKRIGYANFTQSITKKMLYSLLKNQQQRTCFYEKSLEIQLKGFRNKNRNFIFKNLIEYISQLNVRTLRLTKNVTMSWQYPLKFQGLMILDLDDLQSIEVLQNFEFRQLKCIIIGGKNMLNLRSLRKLHMNGSAEMKIKCEQNEYPSRFIIQRNLNRNQQYTFTNLMYLTEVSFSLPCKEHVCSNRVKFLNSSDTMVPINLLAKLNDSSITNLKFNSYSDLNVAYTFAAKYLGVLGRQSRVLLDRQTDRDLI